MKWIIDNCASAKLIVKLDDDVFVNTYRLVEYYQRYKNTDRWHNQVYCRVLRTKSPIRGEKNKWHASFEDYPQEKYPPYCLGPFEIFTADAARRIYDAALVTKRFWIDDVYVTGVLRSKANVTIAALYIRGGFGNLPKLLVPAEFDRITTGLFALYNNYKTKYLEPIWPELIKLLRNHYGVPKYI